MFHLPDRLMAIVIAAAMGAAGCTTRPSLERQLEARQLAADVAVQFSKAADAANRAVMADTDEASIGHAGEAEQAKTAVQRNLEALQPLLSGLGYAVEFRLLDEFGRCFAEYKALDRQILELAVEGSNLKAQRLSFGPAASEADAYRDALESLVPRDAAEAWRVKATTAAAVAAVREVQALQAPHIAAAEDAVMTALDARMAAAEQAARRALAALPPLVQPSSRPAVAAAVAALDRFMALHGQISVLSRRNSNVRSLALTLNEKGRMTRACEDTVRALRDALGKRGFTGTR